MLLTCVGVQQSVRLEFLRNRNHPYLPLFGENLMGSSNESRSMCPHVAFKVDGKLARARQRLHSVSWISWISWIDYSFRVDTLRRQWRSSLLQLRLECIPHTCPSTNCEPCFQSIVLLYLQIEAPKPHYCPNMVYLSNFAYLAQVLLLGTMRFHGSRNLF